MAETRGMKLAITSEEEIMSLMYFLNDCEQLKQDLSDNEPSEIDFKDYRVIGKSFFFSKEDHEDLLRSILSAIDNIHFQRILWNCDVMLKNCADLSKDTLEFSPDITEGLALLEKFRAGQLIEKRY